jgi:hypothetical protein
LVTAVVLLDCTVGSPCFQACRRKLCKVKIKIDFANLRKKQQFQFFELFFREKLLVSGSQQKDSSMGPHGSQWKMKERLSNQEHMQKKRNPNHQIHL